MGDIIDSIVDWLKSLIMGDWDENAPVSAQVVGGVISMIPVVDQVMDARDVSAILFRINKKGGFAHATLDDKVMLGFGALGLVPTVGSAFKTIFKPLWRERRAARGALVGGVAMVERMLGVGPGGAVRWVRTLDWAGKTQEAIVLANQALESCIAMLDYIAVGHWWCPDSLQQLAADVAPSLKEMRGQLAAPIQEASAAIREFLEDMLGEHAAAVAMALGQQALTQPPATGRRSGQTSPSRTSHTQLQSRNRTNGTRSAGPTTTVLQRTAHQAFRALNNAAKGLMGEHIVDYHVIERKGWGLSWNRHDMDGANDRANAWTGGFKKLNDDERPVYLCTPSARVLANGIDSAWFTNRGAPSQFAIVEAKASFNPAATAYQLLGEALDQQAPGSAARGSGRRRAGGTMPSAASAGATGGTRQPAARPMAMQMSHAWIRDRVESQPEYFQYRNRIMRGAAGRRNYSRHLFLVTPLQAGAHINALEQIISNGLVGNPAAAQQFAHDHASHDVQREFGETELNAAEQQHQTQGRYRPPRANR